MGSIPKAGPIKDLKYNDTYGFALFQISRFVSNYDVITRTLNLRTFSGR